jgi:hypothetical protein
MGRYPLSARRSANAALCLLPAWLSMACAGLSLSSPTAPPTPFAARPPAPSAPSRTPAINTGNVYTDSQAGFSIRLPEDWTVAGPVKVQADNVSYDLYVLGVAASPEGGPGMSRIVIGDASTLSVEAFVQQQCQTCPQNPVEDVSMDGRPAQRVLVGGGGVPFTVEWVFVRLDEHLVGFSLHDPETLEPLQGVLASVTLP